MDQTIYLIVKYFTVKQSTQLLCCSKFYRPTNYNLKVRNGIFYTDGSILQNNGFSNSWYYERKLHRDHDQPARIFHLNGTMEWYKDGKQHRDGDKPAYISIHKKSMVFYKAGKIHRDNAPALIMQEDRVMWYKDGKIHNDNNQPAAIIHLNDNRIRREWWNEGKYLRMETI